MNWKLLAAGGIVVLCLVILVIVLFYSMEVDVPENSTDPSLNKKISDAKAKAKACSIVGMVFIVIGSLAGVYAFMNINEPEIFSEYQEGIKP